VLISTPVHLRALLASEIELPPLRLVVCATAPLGADIAMLFEGRFGVEVHEVYGFTEAGMVATRRTVSEPRWWLLPGLKMHESEGSVTVSGGHVPAPVAFTDLIEVNDAEHFMLLGRSGDLVNIAGKRTSISYLEHQLSGIEGVDDAAFFMPDETGNDVTRLMAFAVAPGLDREQLLKALAQRVDPVFLPRPLYLVDRLPRNSTGKLPPVGSTVDAKTATWTNTIGDPELIGVWKDPEFNPKHEAVYYARVIEIPTPRWTAYEARRFNVQMSKDVPMVTQERAYTSPIWYTPPSRAD